MDEHTGFAQPLGQRAAQEELAYIRRTLDAAGRLSIVPGTGFLAIGVLALAAVWLNERFLHGVPGGSRYLMEWRAQGSALAGPYLGAYLVWGGLFLVSLLIGITTMRAKARRTRQVFWSPVLQKALWGYGAAMLLGAVLTLTLLRQPEFLPEVWLGCYGVALVGAGAVSISPIRWMGICFLMLAALAAFTELSGNLLLAAGFGGLHIGFGAYIAWRHDG
jgi:hypothetical protein